MATMTKDPKARNQCAGPGCKNKAAEDAFCSSACCKAYYGVADPKSSGTVGVRARPMRG